MKWNWMAITSVLLLPAFAFGATSLGMSGKVTGSAGAPSSLVLVDPNAATQVDVNVLMDMGGNLLGAWDAALKADVAGLSVAARGNVNALFTGWLALDFGGLIGSSLDAQSGAVGYMEQTGSDKTPPAGEFVTQTVTLNVPALAPDAVVNLSFADPLGSGIWWSNVTVGGAAAFDTVSGMQIRALPEPASLILLALGGLLLRRRSA